MTVADNMAFSLKLKKAPKTEIASRVDKAAGILGLKPLLGVIRAGFRAVSASASPWGAPSCAIRKSSCSTAAINLDAKLRVAMRARSGLASAPQDHDRHVTHDQIEAMTMAGHRAP